MAAGWGRVGGAGALQGCAGLLRGQHRALEQHRESSSCPEPCVTWPLIAEVQGVKVVGKVVLLGGLLIVPPAGALILAVSEEPGDAAGCGQRV